MIATMATIRKEEISLVKGIKMVMKERKSLSTPTAFDYNYFEELCGVAYDIYQGIRERRISKSTYEQVNALLMFCRPVLVQNGSKIELGIRPSCERYFTEQVITYMIQDMFPIYSTVKIENVIEYTVNDICEFIAEHSDVSDEELCEKISEQYGIVEVTEKELERIAEIRDIAEKISKGKVTVSLIKKIQKMLAGYYAIVVKVNGQYKLRIRQENHNFVSIVFAMIVNELLDRC